MTELDVAAVENAALFAMTALGWSPAAAPGATRHLPPADRAPWIALNGTGRGSLSVGDLPRSSFGVTDVGLARASDRPETTISVRLFWCDSG